MYYYEKYNIVPKSRMKAEGSRMAPAAPLVFAWLPALGWTSEGRLFLFYPKYKTLNP